MRGLVAAAYLLLAGTAAPGEAAAPATYLGFGDSITAGSCARGDSNRCNPDSLPEDSYLAPLAAKLRASFGDARVINAGVRGNKSLRGRERIDRILSEYRPSCVLILYGTNDWNRAACRGRFRESGSLAGCDTVENLRYILRAVAAADGLPVLGTLAPVNVGYDARVPRLRQKWVQAMNEQIRELARSEGALLADVHAALLADPGYRSNPGSCFVDHVHPNAKGSALIAAAFFKALAQSHRRTPRRGTGAGEPAAR
jgi:lysophospholipase L1-like esterase